MTYEDVVDALYDGDFDGELDALLECLVDRRKSIMDLIHDRKYRLSVPLWLFVTIRAKSDEQAIALAKDLVISSALHNEGEPWDIEDIYEALIYSTGEADCLGIDIDDVEYDEKEPA